MNTLIVSQNVRSMTNFCELITHFENELNDIAVIAIQETWQVNNILNCTIKDFHMPYIKQRCNAKGGGVGVWVKKGYKFVIQNNLEYFEEEVLEIQTIKIESFSKANSTYLINTYRPPGPSIAKTGEIIASIIKEIKVKDEKAAILLLGDFNVDMFKMGIHKDSETFYDTLTELNLCPQILTATRVTPTTSTLIDNIFSSKIPIADSGTIATNVSDHLATYIKVQCNGNKNVQHQYKRTKVYIPGVKYTLQNTAWYYGNNVDEVYNNFIEKVKDSVKQNSQNIPNKNKRYKPVQPWMTKTILQLRSKVIQAQKKAFKTQSIETFSDFKRLRSNYQRELRQAKVKYYGRVIERAGTNTKKLWDIANKITGRQQKESNGILEIKLQNGISTADKNKIANEFNDFFQNIGPTLAKKFPDQTKFKKFLGPQPKSIFKFEECSKHDVWATIKRIKAKGSAGTDEISNVILKGIADDILEPLTYVINLSLKQGKIPKELKVAKIIPLFKKGDKHQTTNYRPISLLNVISKVLEKIVARQLTEYLETNNLLHNKQFGFRKMHNTTQPVLHMVKKVQENKQNKKHSIAIFCDLKKAFDTVDHNILLTKLEHYGVKDNEKNWFKDYLSNRKQIVQINDVTSNCLDISCGVPQGSCLSALLFLVYINDLASSTNLGTYLFADDTTLLGEGSDLKILEDEINNELIKISDWLKNNKLTFHPDKTSYIHFFKKYDEITNIQIEGKHLQQIGKEFEEMSAKFVGLHIDEQLKWLVHAREVKKKINSNTMAIIRVKEFLPKHVKLMLYNALIKPHLEYGSLIWHNSNQTELKNITTIQKRAIRAVTNTKYNAHTDPLFKELNVLKATDIYKLEALKFVKKCELNLAPQIIKQLFAKTGENLRSGKCFGLKKERSEILNNIVRSWNSRLAANKVESSLKVMCRNVTSEIMAGYSTDCDKKKCYVCKRN